MNYFLSNLMIALGVATTPAPSDNWMPYAITELFFIEIDTASVMVRRHNGGWQVFARMKRTPAEEIPVPGKVKKGAYFIDSTTAHCNEDKFTLDEVTLYAKDGTVLQHQRNVLEMQNPRDDDHLVTMHMQAVCGPVVTPRGKPPLQT